MKLMTKYEFVVVPYGRDFVAYLDKPTNYRSLSWLLCSTWPINQLPDWSEGSAARRPTSIARYRFCKTSGVCCLRCRHSHCLFVLGSSTRYFRALVPIGRKVPCGSLSVESGFLYSSFSFDSRRCPGLATAITWWPAAPSTRRPSVGWTTVAFGVRPPASM